MRAHFLRSGYTRLILPPAWPRNRRTPRRSARVRRSLASEIVQARMSALAAASACVCRAAPSGAPATRKIARRPSATPLRSVAARAIPEPGTAAAPGEVRDLPTTGSSTSAAAR